MSDCPVTTKPQTVDFWERHEKTARLARLTQASAVIYAGTAMPVMSAVNVAVEIEKEIIRKLSKEKQ